MQRVQEAISLPIVIVSNILSYSIRSSSSSKQYFFKHKDHKASYVCETLTVSNAACPESHITSCKSAQSTVVEAVVASNISSKTKTAKCRTCAKH